MNGDAIYASINDSDMTFFIQVSDDDMHLAAQLLASGRKLSDGLVEGIASVKSDSEDESSGNSFTSLGDMFLGSETF